MVRYSHSDYISSGANLLLDYLEGKLLESRDKMSLVCMRYIDGICFSWPHVQDCLKEFTSHLNSSQCAIKFTSEYSRRALNFLDVSIKVGGGPWRQIFFASPLIPISEYISLVTHGIPKKPSLLVRQFRYAEYDQMITIS